MEPLLLLLVTAVLSVVTAGEYGNSLANCYDGDRFVCMSEREVLVCSEALVVPCGEKERCYPATYFSELTCGPEPPSCDKPGNFSFKLDEDQPCTKFYYSCSKGNDSLQRTIHYCDGKLYFDETFKSCVPTDSSECSFEHFIKIGNESATTSNAENIIKCTDNETLTYLNDCGVFRECFNGIWREQDCSPKFYDPNSKSCVNDISVCGRRGFCQLGHHIMDESDCSNFALCVESRTWEQRSCYELYYDNVQGECVNDTKVCGNRTVTRKADKSSPQSPCEIGQRTEINSDCNKYEQCIFPGIWDIKTCTADLFHDSNTASCVNDPKVCGSRDQKNQCVVGVYKVDPFDCHHYQKCDSSGNWVKLSCFNQYFDHKTNSCISNSSVCTEKSQIEKVSNISSLKNSESDFVQVNLDSNDSSCMLGSFAVDTNDCRIYMQCVAPQGEWQIWSCGDFFYDPQSNACVCDQQVCGDRNYLGNTITDCFLTKYDFLALGNTTEI